MFGELKAIDVDSEYRYPSGSRAEKWKCLCSCGNTISVLRKNLLNGNTTSCGCKRNKSNNQRLYKHGGKGTKLYDVWCGIRRRCLNASDKVYKHYGGRGISICDEWRNDFAKFRDWAMNSGYKDGLSIDRINVDGNYDPGNCRWTSMAIQANNRTNTIHITLDEETHTCSEWARITGINYDTINNRYHAGLTPSEILSKTTFKTGPKTNKQTIIT